MAALLERESADIFVLAGNSAVAIGIQQASRLRSLVTTAILPAMKDRWSRPSMSTPMIQGENGRIQRSTRLLTHLPPRSAQPSEALPPSGTSAARRTIRKHRAAAVILLGCFAAAMTPGGHAATSKAAGAALKIYISVDMEGVAGVVTGDQLVPSGFEYERFRRFMTDEAVAAVRGAKAAGATEVVVSDSHANGESLLIELFPKDVRIVRSWPRHGGMMAGLDSSFGAALFVGYHASTTNPKGVRAHTISSAHFTRIALNGTAVTEAEFNAAYAGALGVPVVFVSGDDAAIAEITARLGNMESVVTKTSLGFHSAETITPAAACEQIYQGAVTAVSHRQEHRPYVIKTPIALEVSFKSYLPAEVLSYLRAVERIDSHSIRFLGRDMQEVSDFIDVLDNYSPDLAP